MSKTTATILIFVVSMIVGVTAAMLFFQMIFIPTVPPAVMTNLSRGTAQFSFIMGGLGLGLAIFVWTLIAVSITVAAQKLAAGKAMKAARAGSTSSTTGA